MVYAQSLDNSVFTEIGFLLFATSLKTDVVIFIILVGLISVKIILSCNGKGVFLYGKHILGCVRGEAM